MTDNAARYLGFAFASAELLIELDGDGRIVVAMGATQKLVGAGQAELAGQPFIRLFAPGSRAVVVALLESLDSADRRGPVRAELAPRPGRALPRYVSFSACRLPQLAPNISCAVSLGQSSAAVEPTGANGLHDAAGFLDTTTRLVKSPPGVEMDVAFVQFDGLSDAADALGPAAGKAALTRVAAAVQAESLGGQTAGQLADDRFALIRAKAEPPDQLLNRLSRAAERAGVNVEAVGATTSLDTTSSHNMRALKFALETFIRDGAGAAGVAFNKVLAQTNAQAQAFSQSVAQKRFRLVYQPIVDLQTGELHHFEVLSRFSDDETSPASAIHMAEQLDLVHELDMSVADQAMRKLTQPGASRLRLAINLSARSLTRPQFVKSLLSRAQNFQGLAGRLLFELTESAAIEDLDTANGLIQSLRSRGFRVCLDDFGAGASGLSYVRSLSVDIVKIDGRYVRDIEVSGRADAVVRHMAELCSELEVTTVAEMIETQKTADILLGLGVTYGQGYLYGKPTAEPVYSRPGPSTSKRIGALETWG